MKISQLIVLLLFLCGIILANEEEKGIQWKGIDDEYEEGLEYIVQGSEEKYTVVVDGIQKMIESGEIKTGRFLDVGAGSGYFTEAFSPLFKETKAIEPNPVFAENFRKKGYDVEEISFFDFKSDKKYDLIICMHVMYHTPPERWSEWVDHLTSFLSDDGILVIAQNGNGTECAKFMVKFGSKIPSYKFSLEDLTRKEGYEQRIMQHNFSYDFATLEEMYKMLRLFVLDDAGRTIGNFDELDEMKQVDILYRILDFSRSTYKSEIEMYSLGFSQTVVIMKKSKEQTEMEDL